MSKELLSLSAQDSITDYFNNYYLLLDDFYNKNKLQLAVLETSRYNYKFQERARIKSEEKSERIVCYLIFVLILFLVSTITILALKIREKRILFKLNNALLMLNDSIEQTINDASPKHLYTDTQELKKWISKKVEEVEAMKEKPNVSSNILQSREYSYIQNLINEKRYISDSDSIWLNLHELIIAGSPHFFEKLYVLMGADLKLHESQTILLIKCGISPSQMAILFGKTKTTISSRRESLCIKIIGKKIDLKVFDGIIRVL